MTELEWGMYPPHPKQEALLEACRQTVDGVLLVHAVWGRGGGKTLIGARWVFESMATHNRGLPHLWTEPTYRDCIDTFLRTWQELVPQELYTFSRADMRITLIAELGGAELDIRSRQVDNTKKDPFRGPTYAGAVIDEPAKDTNNRVWQLIRATVRHPEAKQKFIVTTSTPKLGWYHRMIQDTDGAVIHATSHDNPYIDEHWIDGLLDDYSPDFAQQEIYAEFVAQASRIWPNYSEATWPEGNIIDYEWDENKPFVLCCDIGVRSAWLLIQRHQPTSTVHLLDVACAEYTPNDGATDRMCRTIEHDYGIPSRIIVGHDVGTRSTANALTSSQVFRNHWGNVQIQPVTGHLMDKHNQYLAANRCLLNARGQRTFTISSTFKSHNDNQRGIKEVLTQDTWADTPRSGEFMPKDKQTGAGLEDMRDAWLYGMTMLRPIRSMRQDVAA